MNNILIIGYGVVGQNIGHELIKAGLKFDVHDPMQDRLAEDRTYRYAFVCVPTNACPDGSCDTSIVEDVIRTFSATRRAQTFIIKSTIPPGTTHEIISANRHDSIVFSPEYYGGTLHANTPHPFQIIGADSLRVVNEVAELYKRMYTGYARLYIVPSATAELIKYAENTWLAMQVTFFNQFGRIAEELGLSIDQFREGLLLDERISRSHSFVYRDHPFYDSHCLNKDVPALIAFCKKKAMDTSFIQNIIDTNERFKIDTYFGRENYAQ